MAKKEKAPLSEKEEAGDDKGAGEKIAFGKDYDAQVLRIVTMASPLADKKLVKKALKLVRQGSCAHSDVCLRKSRWTHQEAAKAKLLRRGVKEVVKALRKNEKGSVFVLLL